jgi:hypothetical protein
MPCGLAVDKAVCAADRNSMYGRLAAAGRHARNSSQYRRFAITAMAREMAVLELVHYKKNSS